jgi:hypothetical protein
MKNKIILPFVDQPPEHQWDTSEFIKITPSVQKQAMDIHSAFKIIEHASDRELEAIMNRFTKEHNIELIRIMAEYLR